MKMLILKFIMLISIVSNAARAAEYNVAIEEFSYDLKPESYQYHPMVFILKQLHEPLFTRTKDGVSSKLLSNWVSDKDYKKYRLCVKQDVYFSNDKKLTSEILKENLIYFSRNSFFSVKVDSIAIDKDCVDIKFLSSYYGFIDDTQSLKMSIIDPDTVNVSIPVGISDYKVESYTKERLTLRTRDLLKTKPYYSTINIIAVGSAPQKLENLIQFQEINLLRSNQLPSQVEIAKHFKVIEIFDIQGIYILLNNNAKDTRNLISNCLNREMLSNGLNLDVKFYPTTVFPPEAGIRIPYEQNCLNTKKIKRTTKLNVLYYYEKENQNAITKAFRDLDKFNIKIDVIHKTKLEAFKDLELKKYDLAIVRIDGFNFLGQLDALGLGPADKTLINSNLKNVKSLRNEIINGNKTQRETAIESVVSQLRDDYRLIPIARLKVHAFYPPYLNLFNDNNSVSFYEYQIKYLSR